MTYAFHQKLSKASERQLRQLDYISQFTTDIIYVKGEDNVVADALSRISTIDMPTILDLETIQQHQQEDEELRQLLEENRSSLILNKLTFDNGAQIYCDTSTGIVRPYLPQSLRKTAFNVIHGLSHPEKKITSRQLREKYIWPGIKRDVNTWAKECHANAQKSNATLVSNRIISTSRMTGSNTFTWTSSLCQNTMDLNIA